MTVRGKGTRGRKAGAASAQIPTEGFMEDAKRVASKLTPKQEKFCHVYLEAGNACEAYRQAYDASKMSANTVNVEAQRLLSHPTIAPWLDAARAKVAEKHEISLDKIVRELALLGFSNVLDYVRVQAGDAVTDLSTMTRDQAAALVEYTVETYTEGRGDDAVRVKRVKFNLYDKQAALMGLHKMLYGDADAGGNVTVIVEKLAGTHAPPPPGFKAGGGLVRI